jgi:hypothetical protein
MEIIRNKKELNVIVAPPVLLTQQLKEKEKRDKGR